MQKYAEHVKRKTLEQSVQHVAIEKVKHNNALTMIEVPVTKRAQLLNEQWSSAEELLASKMRWTSLRQDTKSHSSKRKPPSAERWRDSPKSFRRSTARSVFYCTRAKAMTETREF